MNDKARQHILAAFIIILLVLCVFSSFYGFPVEHVKADDPPTTKFNWWLLSDTEDDTEWWDEHLQYSAGNDTWWGEMIDGTVEQIDFVTFCADSLADDDTDISKAAFLSRINATWNTKIGYDYPFDLSLSDRDIHYFPGNHDYDDSSGKRLSEAFGPATGTYNASDWINTTEEVGKEWNYTVDMGNLRFIYFGPIKDDSTSDDKRMLYNGTKDWLRSQVYDAYNNSMNVIMITNYAISNASEQQNYDTEVTRIMWTAYYNKTTGWNDMPINEAVEDPPYNYDVGRPQKDTWVSNDYPVTGDLWDENLVNKTDDFWDLLNEDWNSVSVWIGGNLHQDPDDNGGMINQGPWSVNASYDMYGWDSYNGTGGRQIHKTPHCLFIDDLHAGAWSDPHDEYSRVIQFEEGSKDVLIRTFCHELDNAEVGTYGDNTSFYSYDQDIIITDALKFAYTTESNSPNNNATGIHSMPRINPSGITDIGNTTANATMTVTNGYNCSYGVWYGTTFPVDEGNADGNISCTDSEHNQTSGTLTASITGLTPSQLYYSIAWVSNPSGFYNSSYYNYSFANYSYIVNGSGWHNITFPGSIWSNNQSVDDAKDGDNRITIETFLNISNIFDDVDWIFRVSDLTNWNKGAGGNTLTNLTYNEEYYIKFLNATNITFVFDNTDDDNYIYSITFPQELFDYNSSINANNTCENFCQQGGIWDDIDIIFRLDPIQSWIKGRPINTLEELTYNEAYAFYMYNYTANLTFIYDNANINSTFLTRPNPPTNLNISFNSTHAVLTWDKNSSANRTIVTIKIASSPTSPSDGTVIYNGTGETYTDTYEDYTSRFYKAWSYTNWTYNPALWQISSGNASANTTYTIDPPYNGVSTYFTDTNYLNLTWTRGNRSIQEVVVSRNDTFSTSVNQSGNWIRQNSTNTWFNASETQMRYYTVWSYNNTDNIYSVIGLEIIWGALALSCFSENNPAQAINFDIEISNSDFTETYAATNLTNIHYLDMGDIPYGDDTIFLVSNSSYETRNLQRDIHQNIFYNLVFYLPLALPSDPDENVTYAEDYVIHVVGPATEYGVDPPIEGAEVIIRKYINTTEQYETIGSYVTSADGTFTVPLLPNNLYSFNISATGYYDEIESWMPVEIVFEGDRHHTFRLTPLTGEDIPTDEWDIFWDTITFTATMNDIDGLNGTITITYIDSNSSTTNTQIYIYEYWNGTETLIATISNVSENSFTYTTGVINTTRQHTAKLFFNNTANFDATSPVTIIINNINVWSERTPFDFEARVRSIFGDAGFSYAAAVSAGLAIMALVMFGPHNTGIGILACGFTLAFTNALFTMLFTGGFNAGLTIYTPVIIIIGAVYMLVKDPGGHL